MNILRFFRRTKSRYVDDKAVEDFERVLKQPRPSAFDVAMEETRIADAEAWEQIKRDFKREI